MSPEHTRTCTTRMLGQFNSDIIQDHFVLFKKDDFFLYTCSLLIISHPRLFPLISRLTRSKDLFCCGMKEMGTVDQEVLVWFRGHQIWCSIFVQVKAQQHLHLVEIWKNSQAKTRSWSGTAGRASARTRSRTASSCLPGSVSMLNIHITACSERDAWHVISYVWEVFKYFFRRQEWGHF